MRKSKLVERLSGLEQIFTIDDVRSNTDMSDEALKKFLYRLNKEGWIEQIERGKYMQLPIGVKKGEYTVNEFIIGSMLVDPHCIAYWSALHHYGFTEQIPSTVFVQTTSRKKYRRIEVFEINYRIVRLIPKKFFGITKERFENKIVNITDKEKTIVDCLDKPKHCGGLIEVVKGLVEEDYDPVRLVEYAEKIGNTGVIRRLGFLRDHYDLEIEVPRLDKSIRNYLLLDPTMPDSGEKNSEWGLTVNLDERELEEVR
ncbi:MAG: type IV toxin-antitoxin system AbiEi family antitoxin domain-containing protein [Candidatus Saliniplasma sp.]